MQIAFDTNILVRLFAQDDKKQLRVVQSLLKKYAGSKAVFISIATITELYWVLRTQYNYGKEDLIDVLEDLLNTEEFVIQHDLELRNVLVKMRDGITFFDALIGAFAQHQDVQTITFDKKLAKTTGFMLAE